MKGSTPRGVRETQVGMPGDRRARQSPRVCGVFPFVALGASGKLTVHDPTTRGANRGVGRWMRKLTRPREPGRGRLLLDRIRPIRVTSSSERRNYKQSSGGLPVAAGLLDALVKDCLPCNPFNKLGLRMKPGLPSSSGGERIGRGNGSFSHSPRRITWNPKLPDCLSLLFSYN